jgi:hypothetical protein
VSPWKVESGSAGTNASPPDARTATAPASAGTNAIAPDAWTATAPASAGTNAAAPDARTTRSENHECFMLPLSAVGSRPSWMYLCLRECKNTKVGTQEGAPATTERAGRSDGAQIVDGVRPSRSVVFEH